MPPRKASKPAAPSDDIRSSPPPAKPVKGKAAKKKRVVVGSDDEDVPVDQPVLNEADHTHKPMTVAAFAGATGYAKDLRDLAKAYTVGVESLSRAAADVVEASGGQLTEAASKALTEIDAEIRALLDRAHDARLAADALTNVRDRVGRNEEITHAQDEFENQLVDPRAEYAGKTSRQRYAEAEPYLDFRTAIWVRWLAPSHR